MVLRVDRGPPIELQAAGRRGVAQECERQLPILARAFGLGNDDPAVIARQDLRLAVEVWGRRQQRPERRAAQGPARLLPDAIVDEAQRFAVGDDAFPCG